MGDWEMHKENMQWHTIHRCRERFGFALAPEGYTKLCRDIAAAYATYIADPKARDERGRCRVPVELPNGVYAIAVWDVKSSCVVTLLPNPYMEKKCQKDGPAKRSKSPYRPKWYMGVRKSTRRRPLREIGGECEEPQ